MREQSHIVLWKVSCTSPKKLSLQLCACLQCHWRGSLCKHFCLRVYSGSHSFNLLNFLLLGLDEPSYQSKSQILS